MSNATYELLQRLSARRLPDAGFAAIEDGPANTESTALASVVLGPESEAGSRALDWLLARQRKDGGWPLTDAVPDASWASAWALLALANGTAGSEPLARGARWLVQREGARPSLLVRALGAISGQGKIVEQDSSLRGWPWHEAASSWAEPTACALLALRRVGARVAIEDARARIEEGERLLWDRMCAHGGWNYGNRRVLGEALEPFPDTTALVLMSLQRSPRHEEIERSFGALDALLAGKASTLSLALGALAAALHGRDASALVARLAQRIESRGAPDETRAIAFAWLALTGAAESLRVPA